MREYYVSLPTGQTSNSIENSLHVYLHMNVPFCLLFVKVPSSKDLMMFLGNITNQVNIISNPRNSN